MVVNWGHGMQNLCPIKTCDIYITALLTKLWRDDNLLKIIFKLSINSLTINSKITLETKDIVYLL